MPGQHCLHTQGRWTRGTVSERTGLPAAHWTQSRPVLPRDKPSLSPSDLETCTEHYLHFNYFPIPHIILNKTEIDTSKTSPTAQSLINGAATI